MNKSEFNSIVLATSENIFDHLLDEYGERVSDALFIASTLHEELKDDYMLQEKLAKAIRKRIGKLFTQ